MNRQKLEDLTVPEPGIKAFMHNQAFPLSVQTAFVEDLTRLSGVRGTTDVVAIASTASARSTIVDDLPGESFHLNSQPIERPPFSGDRHRVGNEY
jgi:hypothetical protein